MEIIKAANIWAKAEITSSYFFMLFGLIYILVSVFFWQWGNTALTKALIFPILIAGGLLLSAGISFYVSNTSKLKNFEAEYKASPSTVIDSEITRTGQTIKTYENIALKVFPIIIIVAGLLCFFIETPFVRAICIAVIAFLSVLVILDSQALKRMKTYHQYLISVDSNN